MPYPLDLYVLVADLDQQQTLQMLLEQRTRSLGIRQLRFEVTKHPHHDGGCYKNSPALLQTLQTQAAHSLVILDREGSGVDERPGQQIEEDLDRRLSDSGWGNRARAIVIDPEIEIWVWTPSPHVADVLGWTGRSPDLREWLVRQGFLVVGESKPSRPKEALRAALHQTRVKASAALFGQLARRVSLEQCSDRSFLKFRDTVSEWFGEIATPTSSGDIPS